ncbi:MAG: lysylphosphatidylglycerol synthase domain-containing protein, partial [Cyclobacteriaceae bacterium]
MDRSEKALKTLNPNKAIIPVVIGLAIVLYIFFTDPDLTTDNLKLIFQASLPVLLLSVVVLLCRDLGYIYRIRTLTNKDLSWKSSIYVILLWEFASAVTPSVVGGTAVAIFILMKEKIPLGRAIAYVILTAILDNSYFIVGAPLVL